MVIARAQHFVRASHVLASHAAVARPGVGVARVFADPVQAGVALCLQEAVDVQHRDDQHIRIFPQVIDKEVVFRQRQQLDDAGCDLG